MYFFSSIVDGWSIVKLTWQHFSKYLFMFFRLMVGLQVDGPLRVVLGRSKGLCGRTFFNIFYGWSIVKLTGLCRWSQVTLGTYMCGPGPLLGPMLALRGWFLDLFGCIGCLGPFLGPYGRSWATLGACLGGLGTFVGDLGPLLGFSWRSWAAIGAAVCDPGPLLEPTLTVLGCSWGLSLR